MAKIGLIHSLSGTMSFSETPLAQAAIMAIDEINTMGGVLGSPIEYILEDGASSPEVFAEKASDLITRHDVAVLFGGWNSHTRKAVKPVVEFHNSSFWYPMSYEGLEASPNIFYTGSTINQQVMPAIDWCINKGFQSYYLLGSDYIFPITTNKLVRAMLFNHRLQICRETYLPLGHTDFRSTIDDIKARGPEIIINTLNGDSNLYFFRQLRGAGLNANTISVLSTSIAEPESQLIGEDSVGHYACWTYFQSVDTAANRQFCRKFKARFGDDKVVSDPIAMAYAQIFMWKQVVETAGNFQTDLVRQAAIGQTFTIPPGPAVMRKNQHLTKTAYIGRISAPGHCDVVWQSPDVVEPEPWLGVEKLKFSTSHLVIDILSKFPDVVDFNQCLQYQMAQKTAELQSTLERLYRSEKMQAIGQLAGGIAHDFNNILGGILGFAELLEDEVSTMEPAVHYAASIVQAAERAKKLIQQILTFSKYGTEEMKAIALEPIVKEVCTLLKATLPASVKIAQDVNDLMAPILGNATMIHEILLNLATNASHAMGESGTLTLRCQEKKLTCAQLGVHSEIPAGTYTVIEVIDEGSGIKSEILPHIFEPFFTTKAEKNGTGLGLSVVYGAMSKHSGYIQVNSSEGRGSTFRLFFPRTDVVPEAERPAPLSMDGRCFSILLVDDEPLLRNASAGVLTKLGHSVVQCENGEEALRLLMTRQDGFDLLITDQSMPKMTGVELATEALKLNPKLPIVLCTGYSSTVDSVLARKIGIRELLQKPVRKQIWQQTVHKLFSLDQTPRGPASSG